MLFWRARLSRLILPMPPTPTPAMFSRSLGGVWPRPSTCRGTIVKPAPVIAIVFTKSRLEAMASPLRRMLAPSSASGPQGHQVSYTLPSCRSTTWPVPRLRNCKCPDCPAGNLNLEHWRTDTETDAKQTLLQHRFFAVFRCYTASDAPIPRCVMQFNRVGKHRCFESTPVLGPSKDVAS